MLTGTARTFARGITRWVHTSSTRLMDPTQQKFLKEKCFLVDDCDNIVGTLSKKECHLVKPDGSIPLHRAFSVFLFNLSGQLLLQKRSDQKVTYPAYYTNSCCSHPIADVPGEDEETDNIGIKRAAQRRLNFELGIPIQQIPLSSMEYITRIHYMDKGNGIWGEHEIDYVLFVKANVDMQPNSNEISEISFVPKDELDAYLPKLDAPLTPWFDLILRHRLRLWWDKLDNLDEIKNHKEILKLE